MDPWLSPPEVNVQLLAHVKSKIAVLAPFRFSISFLYSDSPVIHPTTMVLW